MTVNPQFHNAVYSQDTPSDPPYFWVQHKGTDLCVDIHCDCGYFGHLDGDFVYFYQCPKCKTKYAVGQVLKLIKLSDEQIIQTKNTHFVTDTEEWESQREND